MSVLEDSTDTSLIVRVQARDSAAWQTLVDLYAPWIYGWTRRYGLAPEDGADVTQDTLLAAHRSIEQFVATRRTIPFAAGYGRSSVTRFATCSDASGGRRA